MTDGLESAPRRGRRAAPVGRQHAALAVRRRGRDRRARARPGPRPVADERGPEDVADRRRGGAGEPAPRGRGARPERGTRPTTRRRTWRGSGSAAGPGDPAGLDPRLRVARATNRRAYDGRPVAPEVLARPGRRDPRARTACRTHWVVGADRLKALAAAIGRADGLMFGEPGDAAGVPAATSGSTGPAGEAVDEGLSLGSLELSGRRPAGAAGHEADPRPGLEARAGRRRSSAARRGNSSSARRACSSSPRPTARRRPTSTSAGRCNAPGSP